MIPLISDEDKKVLQRPEEELWKTIQPDAAIIVWGRPAVSRLA